MKPIAVILAGGKSKRMGHDKADISWHGEPLWKYQEQKLKACGFSPIWVMRNKDGFLQDDENYTHQGPLAGIYTALNKAETLNTSYILFLPVDMPHISPQALIYLAQNAQKQATHFKDELFPLCLHISSLAQLKEYLQHKRSVYGFLSLLESYELLAPSHTDFTNMNKPQDLPSHFPK